MEEEEGRKEARQMKTYLHVPSYSYSYDLVDAFITGRIFLLPMKSTAVAEEGKEID